MRGGTGQVEGVEGLGDGNLLQSYEPALKKVTLNLWFRLSRKGSFAVWSWACSLKPLILF